MSPGQIGLLSLLLPLAAIAENPEILIMQQGLARQDLSIRGSSGSGAGISINGIDLATPYSSRFNGSLPIYGPLLATPGSHTNPEQSGHLIGTAAFQTEPLAEQSSIALGMGSDERYRISSFGSSTNVGGFVDWEKARNIDYEANDMERITGGAVARFYLRDWRFDILSASESKIYGAQGHDGIPANVYAEQETDDTLVLGSAVKGDLNGSYLRAGALFRAFDSDYLLPTAGFRNEVRSRQGSLMAEGRTLEIQNISLFLQGKLMHERTSGDLGGYQRTRGSVLILPEFRYDRIAFQAGLNAVFLTDEAAEWLPQAKMELSVTDNAVLYAAYTERVQQPDFQLLYGADPYHTADSSLSLQHVRSIEAGLHQFLSARMDWRAAVFHRRQENAWDWIKTAVTDTAWRAADLGTLDVSGFEAKLNYDAAGQLRAELFYQWIAKDDPAVYAGLYELDYPEHYAAAILRWQATPEIELTASQALRSQSENAVRTGTDLGTEASLGLQYAPAFTQNIRLSLLVENLWDSDFQPSPGLQSRPRSVSTGITVTW
ncbi:MAG: TonB-dependent receptor [Pontiellaceae bacterium]|nr:TonB-dependent receptor [Pontiellaceae bacterium]MBN2784941.1 TonB-dependent receptor [Pontiellaceae bacterium]